MVILNDWFRINSIKINEEDKYIITCGKYQAHPNIFDTEEEAKNWFEFNWNETEPKQRLLYTYINAVIDLREMYKNLTEEQLKELEKQTKTE